MRSFWRQESWGHLSKYSKCVTNSCWELQLSPAVLSVLSAVKEGFMCTVPAAQIPQVTSHGWEALSPGGLGGPWYELWDQSMVILLLTVPSFCTNPRLVSWRSISVWSSYGGWRRSAAEGVFRWWPWNGNPAICYMLIMVLVPALHRLGEELGSLEVWREVAHQVAC